MTISKMIRTVGRTLFWIAIMLLMLVVFVSFATHIASGGRSMIGSYSFGLVTTGSMEPELHTGCFVLIEAVSPDDVKIGDVISFRSSDPSVPDGAPVTHKVVEISFENQGKRVFTTKGTANPENDKYPVYDDDIYGRVSYHSDVIGAVVRFTQSRWLFPILIVILVVNLVFSVVAVLKEAKLLKSEQKE